MKKLIGQVLRLIQLLERASAIPPLLVRWGVGLMFLGGALHKATPASGSRKRMHRNPASRASAVTIRVLSIL